MFRRLRFARYALRFERAFKTDRWDEVAACFHSQAVYAIAGTNTKYDGESRGPAAIVATFKRMLDEVDRKYDTRAPRLTGLPRIRDGVLVVPWQARYTRGPDSIVLDGRTTCRFMGDQILELRDEMRADQVTRWAALVGVDTAPE